jgi:hypothetical protein
MIVSLVSCDNGEDAVVTNLTIVQAADVDVPIAPSQLVTPFTGADFSAITNFIDNINNVQNIEVTGIRYQFKNLSRPDPAMLINEYRINVLLVNIAIENTQFNLVDRVNQGTVFEVNDPAIFSALAANLMINDIVTVDTNGQYQDADGISNFFQIEVSIDVTVTSSP